MVTWLGICGGIFFSTRIDTAATFLLISLFLMYRDTDARTILRILLILSCVFIALDPYIWTEPIAYVLAFFKQVSSNAVTPADFGYDLQVTIYACASLVLGMIAAYTPRFSFSIPKSFLKWFTVSSIALSLLILGSRYHPIRYFFPIIMVWEVFLPLFLLEFLEKFRQMSFLQPVWRSKYALILLLSLGQVATLYVLWVQAYGPIIYRVV
jgi:hypothetical protein